MSRTTRSPGPTTFLDAQHLRQLSLRSLRAYAYDLLHFARWLQARPRLFPRSPSPHCWTMSAINWTNNPSLLRKP